MIGAIFTDADQLLIVISALNDFYLLGVALPGDPINEPVFVRNAPRPETLERVLKGLRFSKPLKWIAFYVFDEIVD